MVPAIGAPRRVTVVRRALGPLLRNRRARHPHQPRMLVAHGNEHRRKHSGRRQRFGRLHQFDRMTIPGVRTCAGEAMGGLIRQVSVHSGYSVKQSSAPGVYRSIEGGLVDVVEVTVGGTLVVVDSGGALVFVGGGGPVSVGGCAG